MNNAKSAMIMALVSMTSIGSAMATTIDIKYNRVAAGGSVTIASPVTTTTPAGLTEFGIKPGSTSDVWSGSTFSGFCVELSQYASGSYYTYTIQNVADVFGSSKATELSKLWGEYYDTIASSSNPNSYGLAFQACVWEIVYDYDGTAASLDVTRGEFMVDGSYKNSALANTWLSSLANADSMATLAVLTNNQNQDYLVSVPEPATLLMVLSIVPFMFVRRFRKFA
jgi:hypothetical protein